MSAQRRTELGWALSIEAASETVKTVFFHKDHWSTTSLVRWFWHSNSPCRPFWCGYHGNHLLHLRAIFFFPGLRNII